MGERKVIRALRIAATAGVLLMVPSTALAADEVSVQEILEMAAELGGSEVVVEGELVGDYGFRDDGWMWTQLNGDPYVRRPLREGGRPEGANLGIGIRMPLQLASGLDEPGGYRSRGPVVRVTGIWKYHDPTRQGESYLEVMSLEIVEPGRNLEEKANWTSIVTGSLLLAAAFGVFLLTSPSDGRDRILSLK